MKPGAKQPRRPAQLTTCRICGCSWDRACPAGCGWAEDDLCTVCADFREDLAGYIENAFRVSLRSLGRLFREIVWRPVKAQRRGAR